MFPASLLFALAELLVPALTEAQVAGQSAYIRETVSALMKKCFVFSAAVGLILYLSADALAVIIYRSAEAGRFIRIFAPLVPVIYMDIVTDGCLKGLGQMMWSMAYNITEAAAGVALVWSLLPPFALNGYIAVLYICELMNFAMSIHRLYKVAFKSFDSGTSAE
jgi:stage V sporulation protein B